MAQAPRDGNKVPALLAVSNADGSTTLPVFANVVTQALMVDLDTTGSDLSDAPGKRDENRVVAFMAVSSVDGITPVPIYVDSVTNALLIDET